MGGGGGGRARDVARVGYPTQTHSDFQDLNAPTGADSCATAGSRGLDWTRDGSKNGSKTHHFAPENAKTPTNIEVCWGSELKGGAVLGSTGPIL